MDRWNGWICCVFSEKSYEGLCSWISQATVFSSMLQIQALPFTGNNNLIYGNSCKKRNHFQLSPLLMLFYIPLTFILGVSQLWMIHMCLAVHQDSRGFCLLHLALPSFFCQSEGAWLGFDSKSADYFWAAFPSGDTWAHTETCPDSRAQSRMGIRDPETCRTFCTLNMWVVHV